MSLISVNNLTFSYPGSYDNIFENVSFQIDTQWKLGFLGRNGRGKTTFLRLLLGQYEYGGSISASVSFEYFPYAVEDKAQNTLDVIEGIYAGFMRWELLRELSLLDVPEEVLYRPFDTLSNGEQTKVLLTILFLKENSFLLIDEPTNHLDMAARASVSSYLNSKQGFILVSHDRAFLDGCIDHVLSINRANIEVQRGNFSSWLVNRERQDGYELAENDKLQREVSRLQKTVREKAGWADTAERRKLGANTAATDNDKAGKRAYLGGQSKKLMKRVKAIEKRQQAVIAEKSELLKNIESADSLKMVRLDYHTSRLAALSGVTIRYGEKVACRDVGFTIESGDRIALVGKNGSGKSSILKLICGESLTYTGAFERGSRLIISYVPQDTGFLCGSLSDYARQNGIDESLFKTVLRKLDFSRVQFEKDMRDFSGGQKKKALIARSLCERAHLYVWDEPLNYIDVISRMQIENLILEFNPTILFVEHDSAFCKRIATKEVRV
ncbi:MAG: ABC-F type ribosomal protection protein [Clostridia bacterium]|nr:ABC-F type ribosomal protection protein [Clostridia bacterium]